jgi:DNA-binding MarR family transcriptional regulator
VALDELEHEKHPSTYLPRKQYPATVIFAIMRDAVDDILDQWARERPDLDATPIGVVGRMSRVARALEARLEPVYAEHGLEPGWHDLLATLRRQGPPFKLRPTDLTNSSMLTSSGTTKRLDKLEAKGLVSREPDPNDRRGTLIALTDAGRELIDGVTGPHLANEQRLLEPLTGEERDQLAALLRKLNLGLPPL